MSEIYVPSRQNYHNEYKRMIIINSYKFANTIPSSGLIGYWPFNGNANDESVNGNNGTVNGATLTTDRKGNINAAYSFAANQTITINNTIGNGLSQIAFSVWFKRADSNAGFIQIAGKSNLGSPALSNSYSIYLYQNKLSATVNLNGTSYVVSTNVAITDTNWHFVCLNWDGSNVYTYLDGILYGPTAANGNISASNVILTFASSSNGLYDFIGSLDDIRLYNRNLEMSEITQLYNE